ncbi:MAG TPA: peroxiredoxin [Gemmatimonadales bacterium]|jgi:peroxiredoxin Q/BCP|nr:peroxiredoxin [Gemmatimonadales bacterium]
MTLTWTSLLAGAALAVTIPAPAAAQAAGQEKGPPTAMLVSGPDVGQSAPDFRLPWATRDSIGGVDSDFMLKNQRGKTVVLAFYPKDFTSGCTAEMQQFTDRYSEMFGDNVVLVGISVDSVESHQRFAQSIGMPFALLSDPNQVVARRYGSAGNSGYNRRTVYVINPQGRVTYRNMQFGALDPKAYDALKKAVAEARQG